MDSRCKQVSRLGFILLARLPAFAVAYHVFVGFTVTGIARKSHPIPMALARRAFTPAIHLWPYYNRFARPRQFGFAKSAPFAPLAGA